MPMSYLPLFLLSLYVVFEDFNLAGTIFLECKPSNQINFRNAVILVPMPKIEVSIYFTYSVAVGKLLISQFHLL